jgi:thiol-disulfide isomerase/thioredoxin
VELLFTTCPHCQAAARLISKLQDEYGPKGFQALGAGFDPDAKTNAPGFVQSNHVTFPIGYLTREAATSFLGITPETRLSVPQIVFVDKKGVIRQQSLPLYDEKAATEENLRNMIETLLKEPGGAAKKPVATSVKKKAS